MKVKLKEFFIDLKNRYTGVDVPGRAAEAAYYLLLSIFPFFISTLNLIKYSPLGDKGVAEKALSLIPEEISSILSGLLTDVLGGSSTLLFWFSILAGIFSASKGMGAIIKAINKAFVVETSRGILKNKIYAILITFLFIFIIIISLTGLVFGDVIIKKIFSHNEVPAEVTLIAYLIKYLIIGAILALSFTQLYYISPNVEKKEKPSIKAAFIGGVFATITWFVLSNAFSFYVNNFKSFSKTYGSLGGVIAFLVWLFLSANVIIAGGVVTGVLCKRKD